ncbi:alpha-xylosidase [Aggregatilinea lenta]|uniref:alpha-xylosidase n=1 Tax=Aggregatilinea lenta TaxID=913108 RepID=UPI000E5B48D1|nr:alpha-xylosidase [Aggregatilinea lenta]
MKFDEGYWRLLPGTKAIYPVSVEDVRTDPDALTVTTYYRTVEARSDYLNGTIITARFTSPLPNVIRVQLTHFKGQRQKLPVFDLDYSLSNPDVEIGRDETHAWLRSGDVSVVVPTSGEWQMDVLRGDQPLTASEPKAAGLFAQDGKTYMREQLTLQVGETVYGLGEHFGPFVKNGQSIDMWNEDGGTTSEYAYKNVPFYVTSQGYGVLVNNPGRVSYEIASHHVERAQFSVEGHSLDYYLFGGPTIKDALEQYTALSGRPAVLPEWSFGLWLSTSFTTNYNEQDILTNIERMEELDIPIRVFHFDCFWMRELTWCSFLWDERNFPDPAGMLHRLKAKGIKICLWINPYIAEASPLFDEGMAAGYLLQAPDGSVCQVDEWQPGMGFVDFTNPDACAWYAAKLEALLDMGVDAFKTDFGERIPTDVVYHDGSDPVRMHNYYAYLYNQTVFDLLQRVKGDDQSVVFARSATCGNQKFPVHWGGDNLATYPSMAETLRGGLSLGMSGFGYWSHDISGFTNTATPDLYNRWVAFGLFSSHSRLHGSDSARMPWLFGDDSIDVLRYFNHRKNDIMPYLLDVAQEAHDHGWPMMRAMVLEFPDDPTCRPLDTQYMLGPALLVAPIFGASGEVTYYLPAGEWRHLLTGKIVQGSAWRTERYNYLGLPLWVHTERGSAWACLNAK